MDVHFINHPEAVRSVRAGSRVGSPRLASASQVRQRSRVWRRPWSSAVRARRRTTVAVARVYRPST